MGGGNASQQSIQIPAQPSQIEEAGKNTKYESIAIIVTSTIWILFSLCLTLKFADSFPVQFRNNFLDLFFAFFMFSTSVAALIFYNTKNRSLCIAVSSEPLRNPQCSWHLFPWWR